MCSPELSDFETTIWQTYPQDEVLVIGITANNQNQIDNFVEENGITYPILFDPDGGGGVQGGETYDLYYLPNDGSPYPRDFIIDESGIIRIRFDFTPPRASTQCNVACLRRGKARKLQVCGSSRFAR